MKKYILPAIFFLIVVVAIIVFFLSSEKNNNQAVADNKSIPVQDSMNKNEDMADDNFNAGTGHKSADGDAIKAESKKISAISSEKINDNSINAENNESLYDLTRQFEIEALELFPLLTVKAHDYTKRYGDYGPEEGEVWIRIKVDHSPEHKDIMAQVADYYRDVLDYSDTITILLWVGGKPYAKYQYSPENGMEYP